MSAARRAKDAQNMYNVIAAHFTDMVYNSIFSKALERVSDGSSANDAEAYRLLLNNYNRAIQKKTEFCMTTLDSIHNAYVRVLPHCTRTQFLDMMLTHFVPTDVLETLTTVTAENMLIHIIRSLTRMVVKYVLTPDVFKAILTDHTNRENIKDLKREFADYCVVTRESINTETASSQVSNSVTIDASALTNATKKIRALEATIASLQNDNRRYSAALSATWAQLKEHKEQLEAQIEISNKLMALLSLKKPNEARTMVTDARNTVANAAHASRAPMVESAARQTPVRSSLQTPSRSPLQSSLITRDVLASPVDESMLERRLAARVQNKLATMAATPEKRSADMPSASQPAASRTPQTTQPSIAAMLKASPPAKSAARSKSDDVVVTTDSRVSTSAASQKESDESRDDIFKPRTSTVSALDEIMNLALVGDEDDVGVVDADHDPDHDPTDGTEIIDDPADKSLIPQLRHDVDNIVDANDEQSAPHGDTSNNDAPEMDVSDWFSTG